jgi:hypothetical protein
MKDDDKLDWIRYKKKAILFKTLTSTGECIFFLGAFIVLMMSAFFKNALLDGHIALALYSHIIYLLACPMFQTHKYKEYVNMLFMATGAYFIYMLVNDGVTLNEVPYIMVFAWSIFACECYRITYTAWNKFNELNKLIESEIFKSIQAEITKLEIEINNDPDLDQETKDDKLADLNKQKLTIQEYMSANQ